MLHPGERVFLGTAPHVRYLKISEGCDHTCAFCAIPLMRGKHRSRPLAELVREARFLESQGAREINLVAQDLGHYGRDVAGGPRLPDLLGRCSRRRRCRGTGCCTSTPPASRERPGGAAGAGAAARPLPRHARSSTRPTGCSRRCAAPSGRTRIGAKVARLREAVPELALRTTALVGFPGETDADFRELLEFVDELRFDRLGAFAYSAQEGTPRRRFPTTSPTA